MPAVRGVVMFSGGRRRKTSKGGNRDGGRQRCELRYGDLTAGGDAVE
jgi:hypothetical protein